ncbi:MAG: PEP-CTERM sorting domain-containing protein, partial [Akkermansia sp.]|nr:PEP-CTERM sorting domain-containing protein [Akkermansia sp.]
ESLEFKGNWVSGSSTPRGGAISIDAGVLNLQNNDSVVFHQNAEVLNGQYRLRGIYSSRSEVNLSAEEGKSILFRDSVYIGANGAFNINADYSDAEGNSIEQQGDIIFSGATTVNDLYLVKGNVAGTEEEIRLSRTTEVNTMTNLYGGRLRVEDGAIYQGQGIMVHEGSAATVLVKDATLNHDGFALTFNAGTTLQVEGESLIVGDVLMMAQSVLHLDGETTINGALTLGLGMQLAGDILAEVQNLQVGQSITLVSGLESLAVQTQSLMRSVEYTTVMDGYEVQASEYFANLAGNTGLVMRYDSEGGTVSITQTMAVPEPTTATLSLLALAALAVRRRRK